MACLCLSRLPSYLCILVVLILHNVFSQNSDGLDKWSEWGQWSQCSRTCGVGISYIERKCLNSTGGPGRNCKGDSRWYRTCNIQDCPEGSENFRQLQCSQYNSKKYRGKYFKWVAFNHGPFECDLRCMPKGQRFYVIFKQKVIDGTKCREGSLDVCVNGKCRPVGCDLALGSSAKFDKCRVCNGDNSKCTKTAGNFVRDNAYDYLEMIVIPAGSTSVLIKEEGKPENYIALKNFRGAYLLNGDWTISNPGTFKINGHYAKYYRSKAENYVAIPGPIDAPITVQVLPVNPSFNFSYEFYAPKGSSNGNMIDTYKWVATKRGQCSATCAGGVLKRKVQCISSRDNLAVSDFMCNTVDRPSDTEVCNTNPCPPRWFSGEWSHCSRSCGEGVKVRRVHCIRKVEGGQIEMLPDNICTSERPKSKDKCMTNQLCPEWKTDSWSECSKSCGPGFRTRKVYCQEVSDKASVRVSERRCDSTIKPLLREACNLGSCNLTWHIEEWSKCSAHCGKGMRNRQITCQNSKSKVFPDGYCDKTLEPSRTEECQVPGPCRPMWYVTQWAKCSRKCGFGIQMRMLYCATKEGNDLRLLGEDACKTKEKPIKMRRCHQLKPCFSQYFAGEWKKCSKTCGGGLRFRRVRCYADSRIDYSEKTCSHLVKPKFVEICNMQPCGGVPLQPEPPQPEVKSTESTVQTTESVAQIRTQKPTTSEEVLVWTEQPPFPTTKTTTQPPTQPPVEPSTQVQTLAPTTDVVVTKIPPTKGVPAMIMSLQGPSTLDRTQSGDYHCNVWGVPEPTVYWTLNGERVGSAPGSRFSLLNQGRHLVIRSAQKEDTGILTCHAENDGGKETKVINLVVTAVPKVTLSTTSATLEEGVAFSITCTIAGRPKPVVTWRKDGRLFYGGSRGRVKVEEGKIVFSKVIHGDSGRYECNAYNSAGSDTKFMTLTVRKGVDGDCIDNERLANCDLIKEINFCSHQYYRNVCCKTCST